MQPDKREKFAASAGWFFVALMIASFPLVGRIEPDTQKPAEEIARSMTDSPGLIRAGAWVLLLAGAAMIWFGGSLRAVLRRAEGTGGRLHAVALGGAIIAAIGTIMQGTLIVGAVELADYVQDPEAARAIFSVSQTMFLAIGVGAAVMLAATALVSLRTGVLPRWHAVMGWVGAATSLVPLWPFFFLGGLVTLIWTAAAATLLMSRVQTTDPATT